MIDYIIGFSLVFGYSASIYAIGMWAGIMAAKRTEGKP